jgi:hypothetical protein
LYMVFNSLKLSSSAGKPLWVDLCVHSSLSKGGCRVD